MKNVDLKVEGDVLVIRCNLKVNHGPSKSGKTTIVATSEGNVGIPGHDEVKLGLNLYKSR
jgi:hypothetical protein